MATPGGPTTSGRASARYGREGSSHTSQRNVSIMNRTSRITATTLAALLAAAPAAAFAQSSTTGAPGSGTSTSEPGMTTGAPTANQPTAAPPGGMTGDTGQGQQLS